MYIYIFFVRYYDFYRPGDFVLYRNPSRHFEVTTFRHNKNTNHYSLFISKSLLLESRPSLAKTQKAIWRNLLSIQNKAISLVAMRSKELWMV